MRNLLLAVLLLIPMSVSAVDLSGVFNESDKSKDTFNDDVLMWSMITLVGMDWAQTRYMSRNWHTEEYKNYSETNPILGRYPTTREVDTYLTLAMLGHYYINTTRSVQFRRFWNTFWFATEFRSVTHNYSVGIKMRF